MFIKMPISIFNIGLSLVILIFQIFFFFFFNLHIFGKFGKIPNLRFQVHYLKKIANRLSLKQSWEEGWLSRWHVDSAAGLCWTILHTFHCCFCHSPKISL